MNCGALLPIGAPFLAIATPDECKCKTTGAITGRGLFCAELPDGPGFPDTDKGCWIGPSGISGCNDPTIGSYNYYHLSPNGISSGSQRWYGLIYLVYIWPGNLGGRVTFRK